MMFIWMVTFNTIEEYHKEYKVFYENNEFKLFSMLIWKTSFITVVQQKNSDNRFQNLHTYD
jgi:hypothetical protein